MPPEGAPSPRTRRFVGYALVALAVALIAPALLFAVGIPLPGAGYSKERIAEIERAWSDVERWAHVDEPDEDERDAPQRARAASAELRELVLRFDAIPSERRSSGDPESDALAADFHAWLETDARFHAVDPDGRAVLVHVGALAELAVSSPNADSGTALRALELSRTLRAKGEGIDPRIGLLLANAVLGKTEAHLAEVSGDARTGAGADQAEHLAALAPTGDELVGIVARESARLREQLLTDSRLPDGKLAETVGPFLDIALRASTAEIAQRVHAVRDDPAALTALTFGTDREPSLASYWLAGVFQHGPSYERLFAEGLGRTVGPLVREHVQTRARFERVIALLR
jgi:hypothetical protein